MRTDRNFALDDKLMRVLQLELVLKKQDTRSWAVLEKTEYAVPVNLTFGVGGRTGTIGGKTLILDDQNAIKPQA